jgi:hypothetical protein
MEEVVTLPAPPMGYKYKLIRDKDHEHINIKPRIKHKDPNELTPRQLACLKYNQKNREKINEKARLYSRLKREEEKKIKSLSPLDK